MDLEQARHIEGAKNQLSTGQKAGTFTGVLGAVWGIAGFSLLLGYTIYRLAPMAIATFSYPLSWYHWGALLVNTLAMAYLEGYRGFQKGFSPRVAARAKYLYDHPNLGYALLAPFFCFGYFHTSKKRQTVAISLTVGIVILVLLVRLLEQPWRGIVDAGVVVGLTWGLVSVFIFSVLAFTSTEFDTSPAVPEVDFDGDSRFKFSPEDLGRDN
jgi:hypothetical protein